MKILNNDNLNALNKLFEYMKGRKYLLILAVITATLSTALGMVPYIIVGIMAEKILGSSRGWIIEQSYFLFGMIALISIVVKGWLYVLSGKLAHMAAFPVLYDIRLMLATKLTKLPLGFFHTHDAGQIKNMMNEQVDALEEGLAHFLPSITASTVVPFLSLLFMIVVDWRLTIAVLVYALILYFCFVFLVKKIMKHAKNMHKVRIALQQLALKYVYGMKVIKAFGKSEKSYDKFRTDLEKLAKEQEEVDKKIYELKAIIIGISRMSLFILVPMGIWLYAIGSLDLAVFIFFILMTLGFGKSLFNFMHSGTHIMGNVRACMNTLSVFLSQPILEEPLVGKRPVHNGVCFENVNFSYTTVPVLKDVSFEVKAGTITAIAGISGSGKSTIIKLLSRFFDVGSGCVKIGDVDVRDISSDELARSISCVFQEVFLFNDSIIENIRIGNPLASDDEVIAAARDARCHDFIMEMPNGYQTNVGEHGGKLSGGQRQRISIARAILKKSPIILLDEATASIDAENEVYIQEALNKLLDSGGKHPRTLIVVAHRLNTIMDADQIIVLNQGQIEGRGSHEELLRDSNTYKNLWISYQRSEQGLKPNKSNITSALSLIQEYKEDEISNTNRKVKVDTRQYKSLKVQTSYWKKVLSLAETDKLSLIRACIYPLLHGIFTSVSIIFLVLILGTLMYREGNLWIYLIGFLGVLVFQVVIERMSQKAFCSYDSQIAKEIRITLGQQLKRLSLGFFMREDAASIQSKLIGDVGSLALGELLSTLIRGILTPLMLFFVLLRINVLLALITLLCVPLYLLLSSSIDKILLETSEDQQKAKENVNRRTLEFIQGIPVIRTFALSDMRFSRYETAIKEYSETDMKSLNRYLPYEAWYGILIEANFALILLVASNLLTSNYLAGPELLLFMVVLLGALEPMPLLSYIVGRRRFIGAYNRIAALMEESVLSEPNHSEAQVPNGFNIAFNNVLFTYNQDNSCHLTKENSVLKGINLVIAERSMVALVGPSGGGKTTLLHLIARFFDVSEGSISIGGVDIRDMSLDVLMKSIGIVFQDVYLFQDTILENIRFGNPEASFEMVVAAAKAAKCHGFINQLPNQYQTVVGEGGATLSGGEKQRISIARVILKNAPIILLDEATASIDSENEWEIQEALSTLAMDKTLIVVAHRLSTIQHADKIAVLEDGRLIELGSHEILLAKEGRYKKLWTERSKMQTWSFIK